VSFRIERRLEHGADEAYDRFCAIEEVPKWAPAVRKVTIEEQQADGRALRVAFLDGF
jgi:hypothetical protein